MKVGAYNAMQKTPPRVFLYVQCKRIGNCNTFVALRKQPSHPARLFHFLPLVYICADVRYNPINMMNDNSQPKDVGYVTVSKRKLRLLIQAIESGATVEEIKRELEKVIQ